MVKIQSKLLRYTSIESRQLYILMYVRKLSFSDKTLKQDKTQTKLESLNDYSGTTVDKIVMKLKRASIKFQKLST